ncbi:MAG: lamin tail domain-containing protein [Bacteroidaceae bacterium]|nr:lamin tail domain-containing protein [Bacteroidaceae bacterium]
MKRIRHIVFAIMLSGFCAPTVMAIPRWVDVTAEYFRNPSFDRQDKSDWTIEGEARSLAAVNNGCIEMWWGWMNAYRELQLPNGHYRLSLQALFRFRRHEWAYSQYLEGADEHSAFVMANDVQAEVLSEYTFGFDHEVGRCYTPNDSIWFPNSMETAEIAFNQGAYPCELEVEVTNGRLHISIFNDNAPELVHSDNWLVFDQIKLERLEEIIAPTEGDLCVNEVMAANTDFQLSPAFNFDSWIELFNRSEKELTLTGCYLSDDAAWPTKWRLPDGIGKMAAHGFRLIWFGSNGIRPQQAPFKLDPEGGSLFLSDSQGRLLLSFTYPEAISRCSYARTTDGGDSWSWTDKPTPATSNENTTYADVRTEAPLIATEGALFDESLRVIVKKPKDSTLRFTTDGSTPTMENGDTSANGIFNITETTSFRFRCFSEGMLPSPVVSRTFLRRDHPHTLPIIAISTPEEYLYDDSIGVYTRGVNGCTGNGQSTPANWNMDWNRPVNFQYILPETNTVALNQDVDFAISGGWTRSGGTKSFKLKADRVYENQNTLPYPFFDVKPSIRNKTLQVRFGGNDSGSRIKDAALHVILQRSGIDLDVMSYQPAVHYINGHYRGLINVREPNNKDFAFANWGISKDELEIYEQSPDSGAFMMLGKSDVLLHLYELSQTAAQADSYAEICDLVDIDEFTNYMAAELYLGSWDWPDNNLKAYRAKNGGRYRVTFFDLDAAFGTDGRVWDEEGEVYIGGNAFKWIDGMQWHRYDYIYDTSEHRYGEIKFCTFFLNLLENDDFRRRFITTFSMMGSIFEPNRAAEILDELGERVRETMSWEGASPDGSLNEIRNNLKGRAEKLSKQMKDYERFRLKNIAAQDVHIEAAPKGGEIFINGVRVPYGEYKGKLFPPVTLSAQAHGGYRFMGWRLAEDTNRYLTGAQEMELPAGEDVHLVAAFRKMTLGERKAGCPPVCMNEVSAANTIYTNDYFKRADWIELYNTTNEDIDLTGYFLSDDPTNPEKYQISTESPAVSTILPANGYCLVWCDGKEAINQLHAPFKLDADGGMVSVTSADGTWKNVLYYPPHQGNQTVGRYPDGDTSIYVMNVPTIQKANLHTSYLEETDQKALGIGNQTATCSEDLSLRYAAHRLTLRSTSADAVTLTIYGIDGREVRQHTLPLLGGYAELDCHTLPSGSYVVRATTDNGNTNAIKFLR